MPYHVECDGATGEIISQVWFDAVQQPLDAVGALATLLAVQQVVSVEDAANAVGLTAADLVAEAEAWAVADGTA